MPKRPRPAEAEPGHPSKPIGRPAAGTSERSKAVSSLTFDQLLATQFADSDKVADHQAKGQRRKDVQANAGVSFAQGRKSAMSSTKGTKPKKQQPEDNDDSPSDTEQESTGADSDGSGSSSSEADDLPDMDTFQKQLAGMKESDPDFFAFLQKNDKALVAAAELDSDDEGDDDSDEEGSEVDEALQEVSDEAELDAAAGYDDDEEVEEEEEGDEKRRVERRASGDDEDAGSEASAELDGAVQGPPMLTSSMAKAILASALEAKAFRGLARLLHAYRACAYMGASADILQQLGLSASTRLGLSRKKAAANENKGSARSARKRTVEDEDEDDGQGRRPTLRYRVASSGVFMSVVTGMLEQGHVAFAHHLGRKKGEGSSALSSAGAAGQGPAARVPLSEYAGWPKVEAMVRSFLTATLELLTQAQDPSLKLYVLKALRPYVLYLQPFSSLTRKYVKALLEVFGATPAAADQESSGNQEQQQSLVVASFLRLRQMGMALPHPTLDAILKGLYRSLLKTGKFMSEEQAPLVLVATHCVSEAYGIDEVLAYQHAFVYIRQLALQLRQALTTKTKEAVLAVYSWQYVNACRLWSSVLSRYGTDPSRPLFQLLFPFVQTLLGVARLVPTPRFFPLRMHAVGMLVELAWSTRVYIPYLPLLTDILSSPAMHAKPAAAAGAGGKAPALSFMVKIGKTTLATRAATDAIVNRAFDLLLDGTKAYYFSVALPETVLPVVHALRAFAKMTRVSAWRGRAKALADAFTSQSAKVAAKRSALGVPPSDRVALAGFMSKEAEEAAAERLKAREAQASQALMEANSRAQQAAAAAASGAASKKKALGAALDADDELSEGDDADYAGAVARPQAKRRRMGDAEDSAEDREDVSEREGQEEEEEDDGNDVAIPTAGAKKHRAQSASRDTAKKPKASKQGHRSGPKEQDLVEDLDPDML